MPLGTYNRLLIPVFPQIIEMMHVSDWIFASEFQAHHLDLRPGTNDENIQKNNRLSFPGNMCSDSWYWSCSSVWRSSRESSTRDCFGSASSECGTERKSNFSRCKSLWRTHKQVVLLIFSLRQSTLHEMNGNYCNNDSRGAARSLERAFQNVLNQMGRPSRLENAASTWRPSNILMHPCYTDSGIRWRFRQRWGF
jgi:hypothetical protein